MPWLSAKSHWLLLPRLAIVLLLDKPRRKEVFPSSLQPYTCRWLTYTDFASPAQKLSPFQQKSTPTLLSHTWGTTDELISALRKLSCDKPPSDPRNNAAVIKVLNSQSQQKVDFGRKMQGTTMKAAKFNLCISSNTPGGAFSGTGEESQEMFMQKPATGTRQSSYKSSTGNLSQKALQG